MSAITDTNAKIIGSFTSVKGASLLNVLGWILLIVIVVGIAVWYFGFYLKDKKLFNKKITAFEIVGQYWSPVIRDVAKTVKIGSGGFEILYLKALKSYRLAYGGRVGKDTYYFFILPDGYWFNGMLYANISAINSKGGLIPIVTTNPLMRGQYTSLEKQIDSLHGKKDGFWDKYGSWVLSIGFVLIAGVMLWLCYKEFVTAMSTMNSMVDKIGGLIDKINIISANGQAAANGGGLVRV